MTEAPETRDAEIERLRYDLEVETDLVDRARAEIARLTVASVPDANCVTLPNGDCVGVGCMHDIPAPARQDSDAVAVLREIEWAGRFTDGCPYCERLRTEGHAPDCRLAKILNSTGDA